MHLHPRRHLDGTLCSPSANPDCATTHHYPKHRADVRTKTWLDVWGDRPPRHRAPRGDEFVYTTSGPSRFTR